MQLGQAATRGAHVSLEPGGALSGQLRAQPTSPSLVTLPVPTPLGVKARTQPGLLAVPPSPPAYCRHSGCFRTQPAAPGKLKLAFSALPQWADTGKPARCWVESEPTTKQDKITENKLDPRSFNMGWAGAGCLLAVWLGAAVPAADTAGAEGWCSGGWETPPRGQHCSRASVPVCPQPPNLPELACFPGQGALDRNWHCAASSGLLTG